MLTSIDVKLSLIVYCLSASLGEKGFFSSANILQVVDVIRPAVFFLFLLYIFLANSSPICSSCNE